MKVKKKSEKVGLKLNIQKTKVMASSPITSWQIHGETVRDFILGGSKITADSDCSHVIKTLTSWKESYDQPRQQVKKKRHYFVNKGPSSQGYGFSSMYRCERWTIKKAEHWRIDAFELWCWRRLLKVPWTARRSNQSVLSDSLWPHYSTPGFPVHHQLPELAQTHVHWVSDTIQPSHPLSSPALNLSQHQGLFQWVSSLHQVIKVLELQLHHQFFQWIFRIDFL